MVTALLAVVMLLTTLLPLTASAADVTMDLNNCHVSWDYTLTDEEGNAFSAAYGLRAADDIYFNKGFSPISAGCTIIPPSAAASRKQIRLGIRQGLCLLLLH